MLNPVQTFIPTGLCEAQDGLGIFEGACTELQNLIFDVSTPSQLLCRPAVTDIAQIVSSLGETTAVSVHIVVGNYLIGMCGLSSGTDFCFCYNLTTNQFVTVAGQTTGNAEGRPLSLPTTGDWVPPSMVVVGVFVVLTHQGFKNSPVGNMFGLIDISTISSPIFEPAWIKLANGNNVYTDTSTPEPILTLPAQTVANFNNRAYFGVGNKLLFSDPLDPTQGAATNLLSIGDNTDIVALAGLPIQTLSSGVISSLSVFKSTSIFQVKGDSADDSLRVDVVAIDIGTLAPRSVVSTSLGMLFQGRTALYLITPTGQLQPVGVNGVFDLPKTFQNCTTPSRVSAGYIEQVYILCMDTVFNASTGRFVFWYDFRVGRWTGSHTFKFNCVSSYLSYFILSSMTNDANYAFKCETFYSPTLSFKDGVRGRRASYDCIMQSALLNDIDNRMRVKTVVRGTFVYGLSGGDYTLTFTDDTGQVLRVVPIKGTQANSINWGSSAAGRSNTFYWGSSVAGRSNNVYWGSLNFTQSKIQDIALGQLMSFDRLKIRCSFDSSYGGIIGQVNLDFKVSANYTLRRK